MAIIRNPADVDNPINYVATVAFLCCASCIIFILKFKGFKAIINIASAKNYEDSNVPTVSTSGAYTVKREEFYGTGSLPEPPKKITPSMVKLPTTSNPAAVRPAKSTSDLSQPNFIPVPTSKSTLDVSLDPRGGNNNVVNVQRPEKSQKDVKKEDKEQKKLEKRRLEEQKARQKAAQEQAKLHAKREKEQAAQAKAKEKKEKKDKKNKVAAPPPPPAPAERLPPVVQRTRIPPAVQAAPAGPSTMPTTAPSRRQAVSTISVQSDINRSSGPPPYTELPPVVNERDGTGNTSFSKPIDKSSSWDMISQHRQQISRPAATVGNAGRKQMVMDLQYKFGNDNKEDGQENSEA